MSRSLVMQPKDIGAMLVVVDHDRYGGAYSGSEYTAWLGAPPEAIDDGDGTCERFWARFSPPVFGRGQTARIAYDDLKAKYEDLGTFGRMWDCRFVHVNGGPDHGDYLRETFEASI